MNNNNGSLQTPPPVKFEESRIPVRTPKKLWKLGGILLAGGFALFAGGWLNGGSGGSIYIDGNGVHVETPADIKNNAAIVSQTDMDAFTDVEVIAGTADIYFIESDSYGFQTEFPDGFEPEWTLNNGKLTIDAEQDLDDIGFRINIFSLSYGDSVIRVYCPKDAELDSAVISTGSGEIDGGFTGIDTLSLNAGSGDIYADLDSCEDVSVNAGSGYVKLNAEGGIAEASIRVGSGDITIQNGKWAGLDIKTGSGSIEMDAEFSGNAEITTGAGDVYISAEQDGEYLGYELISNTGDISVNGEEADDGSVSFRENNDNVIKVKTGSGEIELDTN